MQEKPSAENVGCVMCNAADDEDPFLQTRDELLQRLEPGDIFLAEYPDRPGPQRFCLVLQVSETRIRARCIHTQQKHEFDRRTGAETDLGGDGGSMIVSVAPLPPDMHNTLVGMDRRYRLGLDKERIKLTEDDLRVGRVLDKHFMSQPLPPS